MPEARSPRESLTEMTELVLPQHGNVLGNAFGGSMMAWLDICGAITAQRHTRRVTVTAAIDDLDFLSPIRVGDVVVLTGRVNAAFTKSLEVEVEAKVEDLATGQRRLCVDAFMTFVPVDEQGKPTLTPPLLIETPEDDRRAREAGMRRELRLAKRKR